MPTSRAGLLLTGGGARASYQAGVIKAVSELVPRGPTPFPIIAGISAGAINGACIASYADRFQEGAERLWELWANLHTEDVFRTDGLSLGRIGFRWLLDLMFGGLHRATRSTYLLDSRPLREFLGKSIDFERLYRNLDRGALRAVSFTATNFKTGTAVSFVDTRDESLEMWARGTRMGMRDRLTLEHVLASSALPIFFAPVKLRESYYGDGGIRLNTPLSPPIHMGADRVFAVGIRHPRAIERIREMNLHDTMERISMVDVAGALMNSIFLDSLESDLERMERINRTLELMDERTRDQHPNRLRVIPVLAFRPSCDLGELASQQFQHFPKGVRYLLRGLGASHQRGTDLLSYLAFEGVYARKLMEVGYGDAMSRADEIRAFFR